MDMPAFQQSRTRSDIMRNTGIAAITTVVLMPAHLSREEEQSHVRSLVERLDQLALAYGNGATTIDLRAATLQYEVGGGGFVSFVAGIHGGFTIASGVVSLDLTTFMIASVLSRGARFFLLAALLWYFGRRGRPRQRTAPTAPVRRRGC